MGSFIVSRLYTFSTEPIPHSQACLKDVISLDSAITAGRVSMCAFSRSPSLSGVIMCSYNPLETGKAVSDTTPYRGRVFVGLRSFS